MHLHLTIPASGSAVEPVLEECYPTDPLLRASVFSCRVSFAQEVAIIESAPLCSTDHETDSLIEPELGGLAPWYHGRSGQSYLDRFSESYSALVLGSGGPVPIEDFTIGRGRFRAWMCLSQYYAPIVGLCSALWQIWTTFAPPPVFGVDRRSGVCSSAGARL